METKWSNLSVIDLELGTKLAGGKSDLAENMLSSLINLLSDDVHVIKQLHATQNYSDLLKRIHKLHGAVCYCGAPRLKQVLSLLETQLKSNIMFNLPSLLDQLDIEVNLLLEHYSRLHC